MQFSRLIDSQCWEFVDWGPGWQLKTFKRFFDVYAYRCAENIDLKKVPNFVFAFNEENMPKIRRAIGSGIIDRAWEIGHKILPETTKATPEKLLETFNELSTEFGLL